MAELKYWIWLSNIRGVARADELKLLEHFGSPEGIYFARERELGSVLERGYEPLLNKDLSEAKGIMSFCGENGYTVMTLADASYPARLKNIFDPPLVLYIRGRLPNLDEEVAVAVVGTRSCTPYGVVTAEKIGYEMARSGAVVVTGLARGIDSAAARGALRAGGRVVGVLGNGIDIVYPKSNAGLFDDVAATGAIITEFAPGTPPEGRNFPIRNRILSGISLGVTLIEAPERSGALITASLALEQGRDVFVVPGNIDADSCRGSNGLLREGASPVFSGWDIVGSYEAMYPDKVTAPEGGKLKGLEEDAKDKLLKGELSETGKKKKRSAEERPKRPSTKKVIDNGDGPGYIDIIVDPDTLTLDERAVLAAMEGKTHIDDITVKSGLPAQAVMSALTMLEITGLVTQEPGKFFVPHYKFSS